jgi:3-methyladenine DNA glycosylase/8-oxoguanine DNA glycosylase
VTFLRLSEPFDFELTTERFRAFGPDLASLWVDGGLHRVVGARELRIEPAPGGVDVEPLDRETRRVALALLGAPFDLEGFYAWAQDDPVLRELTETLAGFRPPLAPDPFETLVTSITAQQVSLFAGLRDPQPADRALRPACGTGVRVPDGRAAAGSHARQPDRAGFSNRKAEYVLALAQEPVDLHELASLPDDEVKRRLVSIRGIGEWTAEWFLARHLARPRAWPVGDIALEKAVKAFLPGGDGSRGRPGALRAVPEPVRSLPPDRS